MPEVPLRTKDLSLDALTFEGKGRTDPAEWLVETNRVFESQCENLDQSAREALGRDFDYELWHFFQEKFSNGETQFVADVLGALENKGTSPPTISPQVRKSIVRNTAVFQYSPDIGAVRQRLLDTPEPA